jgi:hypothetical protein
VLNRKNVQPVLRTLLLAGFVFGWGSPQFADLRPAALDVPLTSFHYEVMGLARDAVASAKSVGNIGDLRFMDEYFSFVTSRLNR